MERDPVRFLAADLPHELDRAREAVAGFLGASPGDLAFVANATSGVNTVLRSLEPTLQPGDELLTTDHEYNATLNAMRFVARRRGAGVVTARIPFPVRDADQVVAAVLERVTPRTRLAVLSHVTSATAIVLPIELLVGQLQARGIDVLVDGAHAPGMLPLDLDGLGAAYYAGNGHKWLCGPKGAGFLVVRPDRQASLRPLVISHGANAPLVGRSRFRAEADWKGTDDPSAVLSLPTAISFMGSLHADGWPGLMAANHRLALAGRDRIATALGTPTPAPDELLGSMAALLVPAELEPRPEDERGVGGASEADETVADDPLHDALLEKHRIQVPVHAWPPTREPGRPRLRLLRISAQCYNDTADYDALASALAPVALTSVALDAVATAVPAIAVDSMRVFGVDEKPA